MAEVKPVLLELRPSELALVQLALVNLLPHVREYQVANYETAKTDELILKLIRQQLSHVERLQPKEG